MDTCYRCSEPGTTREHVPPKCLFPEAKDVDGLLLRKDLITVPSCPLHNTAKSRDDEFLMVCLAGIIGNNSIGFRHRFSKVNKAIRRSAYRLLRETFVGAVKVEVRELERNKFVDILWGTPDVDRLKRCFEHIAHGLHWHHFGRHAPGLVKVHLGFLAYHEARAGTFNAFIARAIERDLEGKERLGSNPDVFSYEVTAVDQQGCYAMRLRFYGGLQVFLAFTPTTERPFHLGWMLVEKGLTTVFKVGDDRFVFNEGATADSDAIAAGSAAQVTR